MRLVIVVAGLAILATLIVAGARLEGNLATERTKHYARVLDLAAERDYEGARRAYHKIEQSWYSRIHIPSQVRNAYIRASLSAAENSEECSRALAQALRANANANDAETNLAIGAFFAGNGEKCSDLVDEKRATVHLRMAGRSGSIAAMHRLAQHLLQLEPDIRHQIEAAYWYETAAVRGDLEAQVRIALLYLDGIGVPRSHHRAYVFAILALIRGDELEPYERARLESIAQIYSQHAGSDLGKASTEARELFERYRGDLL